MKRYNKIIGAFAKTIKNLEKLSATCKTAADGIATQIKNLETDHQEQLAEKAAADRTAEWLKQGFPVQTKK